MQFALEDHMFEREFGIPVKKVYSGELCPDHCNVMVLGDAIEWAKSKNADYLLVVLEATSGMNLPRKIGPMLTLADVVVVTKIDLISQAEREVFRARLMSAASDVSICETNALYGIGIDAVVKKIQASSEIGYPLILRGNPPVGTCTVCVGKKEIGWQQHFGVVRPLEGEIFYQGE